MTTDNSQGGDTALRDAEGRLWQVETVTAPAAWASALVNNDWSGLEADPADAEACRAWLAENAAEGWRVVDVARERDGEPCEAWFSASAGLYGSPYGGADLLDYVRQRLAPA